MQPKEGGAQSWCRLQASPDVRIYLSTLVLRAAPSSHNHPTGRICWGQGRKNGLICPCLPYLYGTENSCSELRCDRLCAMPTRTIHIIRTGPQDSLETKNYEKRSYHKCVPPVHALKRGRLQTYWTWKLLRGKASPPRYSCLAVYFPGMADRIFRKGQLHHHQVCSEELAE